MILGAPFGLLLALLVAGPLLAHLIEWRNTRSVELPTVSLLARSTIRARRRSQLRDLLLLATRMAAVIVMALVAAEPAWMREVAFGDGRIRAVAIVIDDSMSMHRAVDGRVLLHKALARAERIVNALPAGSEVAIVAAGRPARVVLERSTSLDDAATALRSFEATTSVRGTALRDAVELADTLLSTARASVRSIVVLSDLRGSEELAATANAELKIEPVDDAAPVANTAVVDVRVESEGASGDTVTVVVELERFGAGMPARRVRVSSGETVLAEASPRDVGARAIARIPVPRPALNGEFKVTLVPHDALPADDERRWLPEASRTPLILVNGAPSSSEGRDELRFVTLALRALESAGASPPTFDVAMLDALGSRVDDASVIVLANVGALDDADVRRLSAFVERGGSVLTTGGDRVVPSRWSSAFTDLLGACPCELDVSRDGHLLRDGLLRGARAFRRLRLASEHAVERYGRFDDGAPLVSRVARGRGSVTLVATALDEGDSDLPLHERFVEFVADLIAPSDLRSTAVLAGTSIAELLTADALARSLREPSGRTVSLDPTEPTALQRATLGAPGVHELVTTRPDSASPRTQRFVVIPPHTESDLRATVRVRGVSRELSAAAARSTSSVRVDLRPALLLALALLFGIELALRTDVARRRSQASAAR